jgi:hypothetical protein
VVPTIIVAEGGVTTTVATGIGMTVIDGVVAVTDPLVAEMVAEPVPTAVRVIVAPLPVLTELNTLTVSTEVLLDTQLTVRPLSAVPAASLGVAVSCCVVPAIIGVVGAESVTVATGTGLTVIELEPVFVSLVAVIVTGPPALTPVTSPLASTVAAPLFDDHVIARPVSTLPSPSLVVAVSCCVAPTMMLAETGETLTVATGTGVTVIALVPVFPSLVAETVTGPPAATAVTNPVGETVAMAPSLVDHVTSRPATTLPPASRVTAVNC